MSLDLSTALREYKDTTAGLAKETLLANAPSTNRGGQENFSKVSAQVNKITDIKKSFTSAKSTLIGKVAKLSNTKALATKASVSELFEVREIISKMDPERDFIVNKKQPLLESIDKAILEKKSQIIKKMASAEAFYTNEFLNVLKKSPSDSKNIEFAQQILKISEDAMKDAELLGLGMNSKNPEPYMRLTIIHDDLKNLVRSLQILDKLSEKRQKNPTALITQEPLYKKFQEIPPTIDESLKRLIEERLNLIK